MAAALKEVTLSETEIPGAKLIKEVKNLTKPEAVRWLKCRGCRNLSRLNVNELRNKVELYIGNGWDKKFLKDPDGKIYEKKRTGSLSDEQRVLERLLEEDVPAHSWTVSLQGIPVVTHSAVEQYFKQNSDSRHLTDGYVFSKTKKFETSGKMMRINLLPDHENMFLLQGYTRPAMKQAKGSVSSGSGLYSCSLVFSKTTGQILAARDHSCPAGKRGFCKHVAALAYKLVEATMSSNLELPRSISCTEVRQQWGIPSLRSSQDPEKELMKRKPLQEIVFEKQLVDRDQDGGRKRKLPVEVCSSYTSRPRGEPRVDKEQVTKLCEDLREANCSKVVIQVLKLNNIKEKENGFAQLPDNGGVQAQPPKNFNSKHEQMHEHVPHSQRTPEWFKQRIGRITSSKAPAVIGIHGRKSFLETWDCIKNRKSEPQKQFKSFERGIIFETDAVDYFSRESGAVVKECGFYIHKDDQNFGASPDRIFQGQTCNKCVATKTGKEIPLSGLCLLEVKTRVEGCAEPLTSLTGAHIAQFQLQEACTSADVFYPAVICTRN